jgi:acyl dehydratase
MSKTIVPSIRSLKELVDQPLGETEWETLSQQRIQQFADATGDQQWIHVDVERAERESPFGGPIAHGYLTLALVPKLLEELIEIEKMGNVVNSGIEKLRLTSPVPAGARIRLRATIKSYRDLPGKGARVAFGVTIDVEGAAKPALTGRVVYVYFD